MTSLRRNLTRSLLAVILILAGLGLAAIYLVARAAAVADFDAALRAKAQAIETLTQVVPNGVSEGFTDRFFRGFDRRQPRDFFEIWDAAGKPLARSQSLGNDHLVLRPGLKPAQVYWNEGLPHDRPGRALGLTFVPRIPGAPRNSAGPVFQLIVVSDREHLDENLGVLAGLSAGCAVVLLATVLWLIPFVLRRGLMPLDELGELAAGINSQSLATRFQVEELPAELRPIARRLNDLLSRIEASFERERRFSADLAHELRTPLAELRSAAECALKWPESRQAGADRETLAIAVQMEGMVSHMLALARSEQGQLQVRREAIALEDLVQARWSRLEARARFRDLRVVFDLPEEPLRTSVQADPVLLQSIVDNLLENAVEYTPPGGEIEISVGSAALTIFNTVSDLRPEEVALLFERFWRKESARTGGQHTGLGLALARSFAAVMDFTLEAALIEPAKLMLALRWTAEHPIRG